MLSWFRNALSPEWRRQSAPDTLRPLLENDVSDEKREEVRQENIRAVFESAFSWSKNQTFSLDSGDLGQRIIDFLKWYNNPGSSASNLPYAGEIKFKEVEAYARTIDSTGLGTLKTQRSEFRKKAGLEL